jgi:2'-5' RNA ligase
MRLFVALDIDDVIRQRIVRFMEGVRGFAEDARWVRPESLHVTLKFIGEQSMENAEQIKHALSTIRSGPFDIQFQGYGFFPNPKAARVFWIGIEAGPSLAALASSIDAALASQGIPKEDHAFSPHLTLARGGSSAAGRSGSPQWRGGDAPNRSFHPLQSKLAPMSAPEFGTMTAREFFLFQSKLAPGGSQYTKLSAFALRESAHH